MSASVIVNQPGVYIVDADGNIVTVTDGATIGTAEGLIVAGKDGTVARYLRVGADGTLRIDPTGTTAQPITDGGGSVTIDSTQLPATLVGGRLDQNLGAWLGSTAPSVGQKSMANAIPVVIASDQSALSITTSGAGEEATYTALATSVALGSNKSMLGIFNPAASGYVLKLREIYLRNATTTAVTGVAAAFQLHPIRGGSPGITAGTDITSVAHDSNDALPAGLVCKTGGTVAGETATPLDIMRISSDEWGPGTLDVEAHHHGFENYLPARVKRDSVQKAFIARDGQGLHLKCATNTTAGAFDVLFIFTKV